MCEQIQSFIQYKTELLFVDILYVYYLCLFKQNVHLLPTSLLFIFDEEDQNKFLNTIV